MNKFVPNDWLLTDKLRDYAKSKGLTDATIDDQEEAFRLCQFPRKILCWDRAWQRWIRNAIEWGKVVPVQQKQYRRVEELTEDERREDAAKWAADMRRLGASK